MSPFSLGNVTVPAQRLPSVTSGSTAGSSQPASLDALWLLAMTTPSARILPSRAPPLQHVPSRSDANARLAI